MFLALPIMAQDISTQVNPSKGEWTKAEVILEVAFQTALFLDWKQTSSFHTPANHYFTADGTEKSIREDNVLLPRSPKQSAINIACLVSAVGHFLVSNMMKDHVDRMVWQSATLIVEASVVGDNQFRVGVRIRW
jgi:hypothetical protein